MFVLTYNGRSIGLPAYTSLPAAKRAARSMAMVCGAGYAVAQVRGRR
jgi:hypothetical protein